MGVKGKGGRDNRINRTDSGEQMYGRWRIGGGKEKVVPECLARPGGGRGRESGKRVPERKEGKASLEHARNWKGRRKLCGHWCSSEGVITRGWGDTGIEKKGDRRCGWETGSGQVADGNYSTRGGK